MDELEVETKARVESMRERQEARRKNALLSLSQAGYGRAEVEAIESKVRTIVEGKPWAKQMGLGFKRHICRHKFGLAGGFTECSACGVKQGKACTHSLGFAGGFDSCTACKESENG